MFYFTSHFFMEIARKNKARIAAKAKDYAKAALAEEKEIELYKTLREKYGDLK